MSALLNIANALSALYNSRGAEIHNLSNEQREILGLLQKQGLIFNG